RKLRGHEERRPVDAVEADDLLADHVHVGGPITLEFVLLLFLFRAQADGRAVVAQGVEPDVHHVFWIAGHWDAPLEGAAADGEVAQPALDEGDHLIAPRLRADEPRILLVMRQQLVGEDGELEVVVLLAYGFRRSPALRTGRARANGVDIELVKDAILAGVRALVDEALILDPLPQFLSAAFMAGLGGADEIVIGDSHLVKEP